MTLTQLLRKYKKKRAKFYRAAGKAKNRKDFEGEIIYGAFQMICFEIETDLEKFIRKQKQ